MFAEIILLLCNVVSDYVNLLLTCWVYPSVRHNLKIRENVKPNWQAKAQ